MATPKQKLKPNTTPHRMRFNIHKVGTLRSFRKQPTRLTLRHSRSFFHKKHLQKNLVKHKQKVPEIKILSLRPYTSSRDRVGLNFVQLLFNKRLRRYIIFWLRQRINKTNFNHLIFILRIRCIS